MIRAAGLADNERVRGLAGRALTHRAVWEQLIDHVYRGVLDGSLPPTGGSLIRLFQAEKFRSRLIPRWRSPVARAWWTDPPT